MASMFNPDQAGNAVTGTGVATTLVAWLTSNEGMGFIGVLIALAGLIVTWHYKRESNQRAAELHVLRLQRLKRGLPEIDPDDDAEDET